MVAYSRLCRDGYCIFDPHFCYWSSDYRHLGCARYCRLAVRRWSRNSVWKLTRPKFGCAPSAAFANACARGKEEPLGLKKARCKLAQGRFQERIDAGTDKTLLVRRSAPPRAAKPLATIWTKELEARMLTRGITFERPGRLWRVLCFN